MVKRGNKKKGKEKKVRTKEEISEVFEIENGKKKTIRTHKEIEETEKVPSKKQIQKENKILRNIAIIMAGLVLLFFAVYLIIYFTNNFEVEGVNFEIVKMGQLTLYKTSLPGIIENGKFVMGIYDTGQKADYNIYLRTDPRQLGSVVFHGTVSQIKKFNVINLTNDFNCGGDGMIAIANLLKLYEVMGGDMIKDENATCDDKGTYGWVNVQEGTETSIERFGPACYNIDINNCEILKGTEKFMLETLIEVHKKLGL